jgi:excisionase family DNA binding protein
MAREYPTYRTVKQAAEQLNVTEKCVRQWIQLRKIPYTQLMGTKIQIDQKDIDAIKEFFAPKILDGKKPGAGVKADRRRIA